MSPIDWHLRLCLLLLCIPSGDAAYSILCCTGNDNTCSSRPVDCPSNVCFKLVINKLTEERGCLDDLVKLIGSANKTIETPSGRSRYAATSLTDQCHKLGAQASDMSLCKCTNNLCNSSPGRLSAGKGQLVLMALVAQRLWAR